MDLTKRLPHHDMVLTFLHNCTVNVDTRSLHAFVCEYTCHEQTASGALRIKSVVHSALFRFSGIVCAVFHDWIHRLELFDGTDLWHSCDVT